MNKSNYFQINSIVKAFRLIEMLVSENEFELAELCRRLDWPKTTVHRILLTLQSLGYVKQDPETSRYQASIKFFELGRKAIQRIDVLEISHPFMIRLADNTGETVNLGILDEVDIVCIDKVTSKQALRHDQPIGTKVRAHCTGFGKAVLAFLTDEQRANLFSRHALSPCTSKSLKSLNALNKELQLVRERGYAVDNEESCYGVACVGAPISDYSGRVVAGISIAGPTTRIKEGNIPHLAKLVMTTAASISSELGLVNEKISA